VFPKLFCSRTPSGFKRDHRSSYSCSQTVRLLSLNCSYQRTTCDTLSVVEVVSTDVSSCSVFWVWYVKRLLKKLDTKIFYLSRLLLGLCLNVYHHRWKGSSFSIYEVKVYSLLCNLLYRGLLSF